MSEQRRHKSISVSGGGGGDEITLQNLNIGSSLLNWLRLRVHAGTEWRDVRSAGGFVKTAARADPAVEKRRGFSPHAEPSTRTAQPPDFLFILGF